MSRTILTLTTSPKRIKHLQPVLNSLRNQVKSPDAIYINLPDQYRNRDTYTIPDWLEDSSDVTILKGGEDLGPLMKILPILDVETDSNTLLITVDDDVLYPSEIISKFHSAVQKYPDSAFGSRGFNFTNTRNNFEPVRGNHVSCHILQGYGACAYLRRHLDSRIIHNNLLSQPEAFRFSDDVILSNHIASRGISRFTLKLSKSLGHMPWGDEDSQSLKFIGGGTHRRYEIMREWLTKEGKWFVENPTV